MQRRPVSKRDRGPCDWRTGRLRSHRARSHGKGAGSPCSGSFDHVVFHPIWAGVLLHCYHWFISLSSKLSVGPPRAVLCFAHDCVFGTSTFNVSRMDEMGSWALTA